MSSATQRVNGGRALAPSHCRAGRCLLNRLDEIGKPLRMSRHDLIGQAIRELIDRSQESAIDEALAASKRTSMVFQVGPWQYRVVISYGAIFAGGRRVYSACIESSRAILIAGDVPPRSRLQCLMQQLTSAWVFHTGTPRSQDDWTDLIGSMAATALRDLLSQGGEDALMSLGVEAA